MSNRTAWRIGGTVHSMRQRRYDEPALRPSSAPSAQPDESAALPGNAALTRILQRSPGGGSPLAGSARAPMERHFGVDFSAVRVHTGAEADELNRSVQARASTTGTDIFFSGGSYQPDSGAGRELIAHELTHVVQQASGDAGPARVSEPDEPAEVQAREVARSIGGTGALGYPPLLGRLQAAAGNRAVARLVQRDPDLAAPAPTLDQEYRQALAEALRTGDFQLAAEKLNGFNYTDIQDRLAQLSDEQVGYLHLGAVGNPRVGPQSQVAQLTAPGAARASTAPPAATQVAAPLPSTAPQAAAGKAVVDMTTTEKLVEAFHRANISAAVREKLLSMMTPEALVGAVIGFAVAFVAAQFTPVGWAADLALGLTAIFIGNALFQAIGHLVNFADARNATTPEQLDWAGQEFARAVAEIEVDALIMLVTHTAGGGAPRGGVPYEGPPPTGLVLATSDGVLVPVVAETIPVEVAAQLGGRAGATIMTMAGRPRPGGPPTRDFEPPVVDHAGKLGGDIPQTAAERKLAVDSWTREELEVTAEQLERSIQARQAEQAALGETNVNPNTQNPVGANHRVRIQNEIELLRAVRKKLSGS